VGSRPAL